MNGVAVKTSDAMPDDGAGSELASGSQVGKDMEHTIPKDLLPDCKVGDTYTVKATDGDSVILASSGYDGGDEEWGKGLVDSVNKAGGDNA